MDETQIVNGALALLKAPRLTSLSDQTELGARCQLVYARCRDTVLEHHSWNFASVRLALTRSAIRPAFGWRYQYPLPSGVGQVPYCIKVRDPDPSKTPWEVGYHPVDGRVMLTNNEVMQIRYTARIVDLNVWSPWAQTALTYLLAAELAGSITGAQSTMDRWQKAFAYALDEGAKSDSREGAPVVAAAPQGLLVTRWGHIGPR